MPRPYPRHDTFGLAMNRHVIPTATVGILHPLILYSASRGVDPPSFLARFGIDPNVVADVDGRVPLTVLARVWDELPIMCNDPDMPLNVGKMAAIASEGTLPMLLFAASPTIGDGLRRFLRFERVQHGEMVFDLQVDGDVAEVVGHNERALVPPPPVVFLFAAVWFKDFATKAAKRDFPVLELWLRYPEPKNRALYDEWFGTRVHFGASRDRLRLPKEALDWPHPDASKQIAHVLELHAQNIESRLPSSSAFLISVRTAVMTLLPDGDATVERVAHALDLAPRTLQRRLERENTSLRELVDDVRRSLALEYIETRTISLCELAFMLGFSEQSAFHRAFIRWTGRTPGEHRKLRSRGPASGSLDAP